MALRRRAASERGFAVPTVLMMLLAVSAIVGVAVTSAVNAQRGTTRDADTKLALLAAEAGVSQALLHYNRVPTTPATPCVVSDGGQLTLAAPVDGWCPASVGTVAGGTFSYQVEPTEGALEIVSTGLADGVSRRVDVTARSSGGQQVFSEATVLAEDWLTLGSNAQVLADVATGGDITMSSSARICGSASVGVGNSMIAGGNSGWYGSYADPNCVDQQDPSTVPQAPLTLPPVNQGDAPTNNDNGRFFSQDLISGGVSKVCWDGAKGNGQPGPCGERQLSLDSNSSVTLSGDTYSFCKLEMDSNTNLLTAAGANVRIYFDSPDACGLPPGVPQLQLHSNSRITAPVGGGSSIALLFVGSDSISTSINLFSNTQVSGSCEQNFVIYAPRTDIIMDSNSIYCGALAGKTIHVDSNAQIIAPAGASDFILPPAAAHYVVERFVECSSGAGATPDERC